MRLMWLALEFSAATFSGNGIYAQSQVRALSRLGHQVLVVCGKPQGHSEPQRLEGAVDLLEVELPVWGRLDASSSWREFAEGAAAPHIGAAVAAFAPEAVLGVDWHSLAAYEAMEAALRGVAAGGKDGQGEGSQLAPYVFMNYRVYLRTAEGAGAELLSELERRALHTAAAATVLSRSDEQFLREAFPQEAAASALHVLLPALRSDMECLPLPADVVQQAQQQQLQERQHAPACSTAVAVAGSIAATAAAASAATPPAAAAAAAAASLAPTGDAGLGLNPSRGRYLLSGIAPPLYLWIMGSAGSAGDWLQCACGGPPTAGGSQWAGNCPASCS